MGISSHSAQYIYFKKSNLNYIAQSKYSKKTQEKAQNAFNTFFKKFKNRQFTDEKLPFSIKGTQVSQRFPGTGINVSKI